MHSENIPVNAISTTIKTALRAELVAAYPELEPIQDATDCMVKCVENKKPKFIFIIDEWDGVIREARNDKSTQESYLNLLREWFKNGNFTDIAVAAICSRYSMSFEEAKTWHDGYFSEKKNQFITPILS